MDRIEPYLPTQACIALMGDSKFRSVRLFRYASLRDWDYALGHKGDTLIFREDLQGWQRLDELLVKPGKPIYLECILLTQKYRFGPTNLITY